MGARVRMCRVKVGVHRGVVPWGSGGGGGHAEGGVWPLKSGCIRECLGLAAWNPTLAMKQITTMLLERGADAISGQPLACVDGGCRARGRVRRLCKNQGRLCQEPYARMTQAARRDSPPLTPPLSTGTALSSSSALPIHPSSSDPTISWL